MNDMTTRPDGLIVVCKQDCPTCVMVEPALQELAASSESLVIYTQDDPAFPAVSGVVDDRRLSQSYHLNIETVPTLIRVVGGEEVARTVGWDRAQWRQISGMSTLGAELPEFRPGCGALNVMPGIAEQLDLRFGQAKLNAREIELAELEDEVESCFERGWSDGLPVVPPTPVRVWRMLQGTSRAADEVVGMIPPNNVACTVEKVAINAVMAGCKPEYMPVVLAAVEAACMDEFCMHGLLATTYFSGPVVIVNGPIRKAIGMNSGINALGQGNRANATIGRALNLIIRNVGGGLPGGVDRAVLGTPGKYSFCFAENEEDSPWESLAVEKGFSPDSSTVTLFAGGGIQGIIDQISRTPESLARSFAASLRAVGHTKLAIAVDAILIVVPEHARIFHQAGWSKAKLKQELNKLLMRPAKEMLRGTDGIAEGLPERFAPMTLPKFRPGGLQIVHAGGNAGMFSAILSGWAASGPRGSQPVTKEIGDFRF